MAEDFFSIVVMPDTQLYADVGERARKAWGRDLREYFFAQTRWIASSREELRTRFVVHVGDITERGRPGEWDIARAAFAELDGVVPYALAIGDHDYNYEGRDKLLATRRSRLNETFPCHEIEKEPWYGGRFNGTNENAFYTFREQGLDFLILCVESAWPQGAVQDGVLEWANGVLAGHPRHRAIIVTHSFLLDAAGTIIPKCEWLWDALSARHENVFLLLCGHMYGEGRIVRMGKSGNPVHQLLANYQHLNDGGEGWLRMLTFVPADNKIMVQTYSPALDEYKEEPESQFDLDYEMG